ncbi:MAG: hypothetical protein E7812_06990 [Phenylobacterium sp.]|nr:MAG: hypothetical protein E7812_06990 [Phenylobacterium sp.]
MRIVVLAAATLAAGLATAAQAAPASVNVVVGPELQAKAERYYGVRDVNELADELRTTVTQRLAHTGAYDGARVELVLADATPNRPTFKQLGDKPGLSEFSFGVGGARIEGRVVAPDGRVTPVGYSYQATSLADASHAGIWGDADWTIERFASELGHGKALASR